MRHTMNWTRPRDLAASMMDGVKHQFEKLREHGGAHEGMKPLAENRRSGRRLLRSQSARNSRAQREETETKGISSAARARSEFDAPQNESASPDESNEQTRVIRRDGGHEAPEGHCTTVFEGVALKLRNKQEGRHRLCLDVDLMLKGSADEGEISAEDESSEDEAEALQRESLDEDEEGIEAGAEDEDEEGIEAGAEDEDEESIEASAEGEDEDEDEEGIEASAEGEDEDEEGIEASAEDEDEDEDEEGIEAGAEDEDEGEDEEGIEAGAEDEDEEGIEASAEGEDEEEDIQAAEADRDDDEARVQDEDEEDLHDTEREKRAALRSAGDAGALQWTPTRARKDARGAAGSGIGAAIEPGPKPRPAKSQADRVIAIAKKQVGVREGKNNYTKFAAELIKDKIADRWWQNQPWCQTFQAWVFVEAGLRKLAPMTPGCATAVAWFRRKKRVNQYPAIGAQVFYGPGGRDHVGLVYKYDPTHIWTIEGNTNDQGSAEGVGVFLKKRSRKSAFGYGYPQYAEGIVTADPRKKGQDGFTFKKAASSGAKETASEPEREEKSLPWVSVKQVQWAATHSTSAERAAKAGVANPRDDVKLVQQALEKVLGVRSQDPDGIYGEDTERLFNRFRRDKLKFTGSSASGKPGPKALAALGRRSDLFRVRSGSMSELDEKSGPTTPAQLSPRDVTFKRFTSPSTPEKIGKWIREACRKAGATPSSAWVKGYKTIISRESSGDPNACNVWDSNAKTPPGFKKVKDFGNGYTRQGRIKLNGRPTHFQCSRGIVQCIPQTFARHHARGTSRNIYDPVASIASSMRYVLSRYNVAKDGSNLARRVQQADPSRPPKGY